MVSRRPRQPQSVFSDPLGGVRPCREQAAVVASLWRSALRADCAAMLGAGSRRAIRYANGVRCARTGAASMSTKRAARADPAPARLAVPEARRRPPAGGTARPV